MACSFEKILSDLKCLTVRLKYSDELSGKIVKDTSYFHEKLKSWNEVQVKITELTEICCANDQKSETEGFSRYVENSKLEELRVENVELKELLRDYHIGVEIMMTKYREEVSKFMGSGDRESPSMKIEPIVEDNTKTLYALEEIMTNKYNNLIGMAALYQKGSQDSVSQLEDAINQIQKDNENMRIKLGLSDNTDSSTYYTDAESDSFQDDEMSDHIEERGSSRSSSLASDTSNRTLV